MCSYYITTHFITSKKDCNSYRIPHSMYQMYPKCIVVDSKKKEKKKLDSHVCDPRIWVACLLRPSCNIPFDWGESEKSLKL